MEDSGYKCPKCGNDEYKVDKVCASKGLLEYFNPKCFTSISCTKCHYTELYKTPYDSLQNILENVFGKQKNRVNSS